MIGRVGAFTRGPGAWRGNRGRPRCPGRARPAPASGRRRAARSGRPDRHLQHLFAQGVGEHHAFRSDAVLRGGGELQARGQADRARPADVGRIGHAETLCQFGDAPGLGDATRARHVWLDQADRAVFDQLKRIDRRVVAFADGEPDRQRRAGRWPSWHRRSARSRRRPAGRS